MKITNHARVEIMLGLVLTLGSCGDSAPRTFTAGDKEALELSGINARRAAAASSAMVDRVERLESRVDDLESKLNM